MTDGSTAQAAAQANATLSTAVQSALKGLSPTSMIQTIGYSVYPRYSNQGQSLTGYTASNTIQVTSSELQAGATNVSGLTFSLQNPEPLKQQALTQAGKQARAHADAIAAGLGGKTGPVVSSVEGSTYAPVGCCVAGFTKTRPDAGNGASRRRSGGAIIRSGLC